MVAHADLSHTVDDDDNKPEGLAVVPIDARTNTACKTSGVLTADFVVYVADYCNDRVHVFTVDTDGEVATHRDEISFHPRDQSG